MFAAAQNANPWRNTDSARACIRGLAPLLMACGLGVANAAAPPVQEERRARSEQNTSNPVARGEPLAKRTTPNRMLHTQGLRVVDGQNREVRLRGVLLEGWLMWNGTLWGAGLVSESRMYERLEQMAGAAAAAEFRTGIYDHFITEADIRMIAEAGFNTVRVPFNHTILEDGNPLSQYTSRGWGYLDRLLDWCERHRVYVVLDLHSVPGGQAGLFTADPDRQHVWASEAKKEQTIALWKAIAARYRDREIVAGYDLINEPDAPRGKDLVELYRRIIAEIRTVDPDHMIILEGNKFAATDFSAFRGPLDANQVYSFHSYNFLTDGLGESNLKKYAKLAEAHNVPLWNGEIGAHKATWVEGQVKLFEDPAYPVCGWVFWPWKRVAEKNPARWRHLMEIRPTPDWKKVAGGIASLFGPSAAITPEIAQRGMSDFLNSIRAENIVGDEEIKRVLNRHRSR